MVYIGRAAALCLAASLYAAMTSLALASDSKATTTPTTTTAAPTATVPVAPSTNTTSPAKPKIGVQSVRADACEITFTYWDHDYAPRFDINFVHTRGTDHTSELFDSGSKPTQSSNVELLNGQLNLVQIWPGERMVCISAITLECGEAVSGYGYNRAVTITADAMQESWIRKTNGDRKPVDWAQGPCMYFRSAPWDGGAFRALDISRRAFECGGDYGCIAGCIETFGN